MSDIIRLKVDQHLADLSMVAKNGELDCASWAALVRSASACNWQVLSLSGLLELAFSHALETASTSVLLPWLVTVLPTQDPVQAYHCLAARAREVHEYLFYRTNDRAETAMHGFAAFLGTLGASDPEAAWTALLDLVARMDAVEAAEASTPASVRIYESYVGAGAPRNLSGSRVGYGHTQAQAHANAAHWANQAPYAKAREIVVSDFPERREDSHDERIAIEACGFNEDYIRASSERKRLENLIRQGKYATAIRAALGAS